VKNVISLLSAVWVAANLTVGFILLLPVSLISWLIPLPTISRWCSFIVDYVYRFAVKVDSFWMLKVVGIELIVIGEPNIDNAPVVICNHRSWFDIALVQEIITSDGPIIKFLVKREIAWVPIIGWICMVLNFPMLQRRKKDGARERDFSIIQKATKNHGHEAGALLVFPEGTRFSEQKKINQESPYKHLLKPKTGGLKVIKQHAAANTSLVDVTINYHKNDVRIWNCLHGNPATITITLNHYKLSEIDDLETWLNDRWLAKDKILSV
jgi:1-acyl-sn-glycerol-3-phosphate acyltransferase